MAAGSAAVPDDATAPDDADDLRAALISDPFGGARPTLVSKGYTRARQAGETANPSHLG